MNFEEALDQALAMLQRRGRVTYRTLKLQFELDDDRLEALKDELLYSQPQIVDDKGRGLIWTGDTETSSPTPPPDLTPTPTIERSTPDESAPPVPTAPEAERRQLTVMFCDLVGSTRLSGQLDPEELREVVRAYQAACDEVIQRFDGHIAQYLGDGLLVYFGYPHAHEDDAQRAVLAGLGIVTAISALNPRLERTHGAQLAVRTGIHTGLVVVGDMGGPSRQEQLAPHSIAFSGKWMSPYVGISQTLDCAFIPCS